MSFARLRGTGLNAPNLSSLSYQLELLNLNHLYQERATAVIYQHLGILSRSGRRCEAATTESVRRMPHIWAGMRKLAREAHEGRLWVGGLGRVLRYMKMSEAVSVRWEGRSALLEAAGVTVEDPQRFFAGLTLYYHPALAPAVTFRGKELAFRYNGPDETGRYSLSVPFPQMADIW